MGCIPSTAAYPGNKRIAKPSYQPGANEFEQVNSNTAVCTTHFVTCAGGNALKLVGKPNRAEGSAGSGDGLAKYIQGEYMCICCDQVFYLHLIHHLQNICHKTSHV
jgi:hypothetical protein